MTISVEARTVQLHRYGMRKAMTKMKLNMARNMKMNKKGLFSYVSQKRKSEENVPQLMN